MAKRSHSNGTPSARLTPRASETRSHNGRTSAPVPAVIWAPPGSSSAPLGPSPEAVALFERAMQALQRHQYAAAGEQFRSLLAQFPSERALLDRARIYASLCDRESRRGPGIPLTPEERLTAATAALNNGDVDSAEKLAEGVLEGRPDHDLALYLLAVVHARRGATDNALAWLGRALNVSPDITAQARHDSDFEALRGLEAFKQLLELPVTAQSGNGRGRRPRSER